MNEAKWKEEDLRNQSMRLLEVLNEVPGKGVYSTGKLSNGKNHIRVLNRMVERYGVFEPHHLRASIDWLRTRDLVDAQGRVIKNDRLS